jgi:hypothetical protein
MNKEIKARWIEALRSGNYEQGRYSLRRGSEFCCLGVLCDIVKDDVNCDWMEGEDSFGSLYKFAESDEVLPELVVIHADLKERSPELHVAVKCGNEEAMEFAALANLNDSGEYSFERLADLIEEQF